MILGTAGHIDHGKTELVRALTGIETDRLREEKERGISIDIGFAWLDVGGRRVGIVDVPGHERFIRNMLAGAHGIDVVMLVVAADDGVMPQTEEHLDIVHLLGARRGLVVLSKVDLVSPERRHEARQEIALLVDGTVLEDAPVLEVSTVTGEGIDELRGAIAGIARSFEEAASAGLFRMPVDRAFVIHGHGAVATGTTTSGTVEPGQKLRVLPSPHGTDCTARVRAVQVHGDEVARAGRGQRIALNLAGVDAADLRRGQVLCDPALARVTDRFDAFVELRPAVGRPLRRHSLVRLHLGTAEVMAKILYLDGRDALAARETAYVQIVSRAPLAAFAGDRFILREQTARKTIGGGTVLYARATAPADTPRRRRDPRLAALVRLHEAEGTEQRLLALLDLQDDAVVAADALAAAANMCVGDVHTALQRSPSVERFPDHQRPDAYASGERWRDLRDAIVARIADFHEQFPRRAGVEMEHLHSQVAPALPAKLFRDAMARLESEGALQRDGSLVRLPGHSAGLDQRQRRLAAAIVARLDAGGFTPPEPSVLADELGATATDLDICIEQLARDGRVARIDDKLVYSAGVLEQVQEIVRAAVAAHGEIDARRLRDQIGASRKYSIALLTYLDRTGFTMRVGDVRKLRPTAPAGAGGG